MSADEAPSPRTPRLELLEALDDLHHRAGRPSMRRIGRAVGCSHTTVSKIFSAPDLPSWQLLELVVTELGGDGDRFRWLWYRATGGKGGEPASTGPIALVDGPRPAPVALAGGASVEEWVLTTLDATLGRLPQHDLLLRVDEIDHIVVSACERQLIEYLGHHCDLGAGPRRRSAVCLNDHILQARVQPDLVSGRTLQALVHDWQVPAAEYLTVETSLTGHTGQFARIRLTVPRLLGDLFAERCCSTIRRLVTTAYGWLDRQLIHAFGSMASTFDKETLHVFRKHFAAGRSHAAKGEPFLAAVTNNRAFYVIDDHMVRSVLAASRAHPGGGQAPAVVAADMLVNSIPFETSFSYRAVTEERVVPVDLTHAPYRRVAQEFLLAQSSVQSWRTLLAPLVRRPDVLLLAAYPAEADAAVSRIINAARAELRDYLSTTQAMARLPVIRGPAPDAVMRAPARS